MLEGFKINCYPLNRSIRVTVHLPKYYNSTNRFYPVLYFLDGQNVYQDCDSYRGVSLNLEHTIESLSQNGKEAIYVSIAAANNPEMRKEEYKNTMLADFIMNQIHPYLATRYRFNAFIYMVACSTAALTALYLSSKEFLKGIVLLSPICDANILSTLSFVPDKLYYIYAGTKESSYLDKTIDTLKTILPNPQILLEDSSIHDESIWKDKLHDALDYLVL